MTADAWSRGLSGLLLIALLLALLSMLLVWSSTAAWAETRYVTEDQRFNMRSGEGLSYRITGSLSSGEPVEVLAVNPATGYSRVRTSDGKEGYVLSRFLQEEPTARARLEALGARLAAMESNPDELSLELQRLRDDYQLLQSAHQQVIAEKELLEQDLGEVRHAAANAIRINRERRELQTQVEALTLQVEELRHDSVEARNRENQRWFMIGAAVVIVSLLLGFLLPNIRLRTKRQSNRWDTL